MSDSTNNPSVTRRAQFFVIHFFEKVLLCDSALHEGVRFRKSAVSETVISSAADENKLKQVEKMERYDFLMDCMLSLGYRIAVINVPKRSVM